jgi:hypothetical protein
MGARKSRFLEFVPLFVKKHFSGNPDILKAVALDAKLRAEQRIIVLTEYSFDVSHHKHNNNKNSAFYSKGCGCNYCIARHNYVNKKKILHREKRAFEDDYYYIGEEILKSEREEFFKRKEQLENEIQNLRTEKNVIKEKLLELGIRIVE